jgi:starch-binding outer membrane protein, SusD/RagB family
VSASNLNLPATPDFNQPIVTCAETRFIIAEAQYRLGLPAAAIAAAQAGVACEEDRLGVNLTAAKLRLATLAGGALLDAIMTQKYIAQFLNMDVWNDYKRTCLPAFAPQMIRNSLGTIGVPGRLFYGQGERQTNSFIPDTDKQPQRNDNDPEGCVTGG